MWEQFKWDRVKAELRGWSPTLFIFELFISALFSYIISLALGLYSYQLLLLTLLTFGSVTSLLLVLQPKPQQPAPPTVEQLQEQLRADEITRLHKAVTAIQCQIITWAESAPEEEPFEQEANSRRMWDWFSVVNAYLQGTCSDRISSQFYQVADHTKSSAACKAYLLGVAAALSTADLRPQSPDPW